MFCPYKNSYLQLGSSMGAKVINKVVRRAMRRKQFDPHDELPPAQRLESMQPSLYAPCVDITRAKLGFERLGLRIINKNITSEDSFIKLQAIHSLLDQVQISENALFLISLNVVYNLIDLMEDRDPIVREKVTMILTQLGRYYQGRKRIIARPVIVDRLMFMFLRDRKEIRYVAALCLQTLTKHKCACEMINKNDKIIDNLLRVIKNDHLGIVILHIKSVQNLSEWDPVTPLKANAFQVMMKLMAYREPKVTQAAMNCLTQLCKHSVGKKLADKYDLTNVLMPYLESETLHVIIAALGLMEYTTMTTPSKWRAREFAVDLTQKLVTLCTSHSIPVLQVRALQVLINFCDSPDLREHIRKYYEKTIANGVKIRTHEQWDGTTETTEFGLETGHNYRTMCIENVETIKNDYGDTKYAVNVHSYLKSVKTTKEHLFEILNYKPYRN